MKWSEFFATKGQLPARGERLDDLTIKSVTRIRTTFAEALKPRQRLQAEMLGELGPLDPEMPLTGKQTEERQRVLADVEVLEKGNWVFGHSDSRLTPFADGPGIDHLVAAIALCDELLASEEAQRQMTWPAPFRYVGRPGSMHFDGRVLRRGDVVMLSRERAEAWSDKFVPAEVEAAATT